MRRSDLVNLGSVATPISESSYQSSYHCVQLLSFCDQSYQLCIFECQLVYYGYCSYFLCFCLPIFSKYLCCFHLNSLLYPNLSGFLLTQPDLVLMSACHAVLCVLFNFLCSLVFLASVMFCWLFFSCSSLGDQWWGNLCDGLATDIFWGLSCHHY